MLALSIVAPNGARSAAGRKTLEIRNWCPQRWPLRDLLLVENGCFLTGKDETDPDGLAIAVVDIETVRPWLPSELEPACARQWTADMWAWEISHVRPLRDPFGCEARTKLYQIAIDDVLRRQVTGR